ncbi:MAG: hypothetical protein MJE77_29735 [Proteobacteria bacterium]|nr:hypothetical protein [Pseudomonadota bacterium]
MSEHLKTAREYHALIREALMNEWDPIGVKGIPDAADEYDSYVPQIHKLLIERKAPDAIFEYLWWLETEHMGLSGDRQATLAFAARLAELPKRVSPPG